MKGTGSLTINHNTGEDKVFKLAGAEFNALNIDLSNISVVNGVLDVVSADSGTASVGASTIVVGDGEGDGVKGTVTLNKDSVLCCTLKAGSIAENTTLTINSDGAIESVAPSTATTDEVTVNAAVLNINGGSINAKIGAAAEGNQ